MKSRKDSYHNKKAGLASCSLLILVGSTVIFSHQFLEDLEKLWAMREWIPDPTKPIPPIRIQD